MSKKLGMRMSGGNSTFSMSMNTKNTGEGGTSNYQDLNNKPKINDVELSGNKTAKELGLVDKATYKALEEIVAKKLNDILVGNKSIVVNGVANIPQMTHNNLGVAKVWNAYGINIHDDGTLMTQKADNSNIDKRDSNYRPIVPTHLDYAVKKALTDGKGEAWTSEEQSMARSRLGLEYELIGTCTITEDDVSLIQFNIDTKGQAFSLERFKLVFNKDKSRPITVNTNSVVRVGFNNEDVFFNTGLQTTNNIATYYEVYPDYALGTFASYKANNNSTTQDGTLISAKQNKPITQVQIQTTNGGFHNGLYIELWGVRG